VQALALALQTVSASDAQEFPVSDTQVRSVQKIKSGDKPMDIGD
jgi:hypothetical protein